MTIAYPKKTMLLNLIVGLIAISSAVSLFIEQDVLNWHFYGMLVFGIFRLGDFLWQYFMKYVIINDDRIIVKGIPDQWVAISDLQATRYQYGTYIFETASGKLEIEESKMNKQQIVAFNTYFKALQSKMD